MKKLFTLLTLLTLAITTAWAGEKTITISRNDVDWESANTVYNITKGGVELVMSGGMNNPNFLLMKQQTTITIKSHNFNIKRIVFHCLDNFTNGNLDPFYWGPTTLHIQKNQTHNEIAGTLTYNYGGSSYDALWVSTKSSTPGNYPDGLPAGYELMFYNEGKPVRFASIDITVEQAVGDMYELVTSTSEINTTDTYMLVGRNSSTTTIGKALSVNPTGTTTIDNQTSTPVTLIDNGLRVKAVGDVQFINFKSSTHSTYKYYIKTGEQYLRSQTAYQSPGNYNNGFCLTKVANANDNARVRVEINESGNASVDNWEHFAEIVYQFSDSYNPSGSSSYYHYAIRHNNNNNQFRNLYVQGNTQQVYLYKPSTPLIVTSEVKPESPQGEEPYGIVSLRDGILVESGINYSQKMDTVQFLATPKNGYKIKSVTIQEVKRDNNTHVITEVVGTVEILSSSQSINGTLYNFVMPANGAHIIVEFEQVVYHNISTEVKPNVTYGNIFLTEGYVVQNDQVKSYDGETVVFNVTPNPKDPSNENSGYHELYSVVVTKTATGEEIPYTYADGNYSFTMPDCEVTITATFVYENGAPLYLLGTANGNETWLPYGPRFNYDPDAQQYYLDVYFKGTGNYGDQTGDSNGYFSFVWKQASEWNDINNQNPPVRGVPTENNLLVDTSTGGYRLYYQGMDNLPNTFSENNAYKIPAGIYRFYVKSYGYQNDWLYITKTDPTLTFNPAGGTADAPEQVSKGQTVTLAGDLYSKIMAINPDEPATNFYYKTEGIIAEPNPVSATTSTDVTLNEVNDGETITTLTGHNYLGWIVADNTAYYKVIDTSLKWIEKNANPGDNVVVSNELVGVYRANSSLWCKDKLPYKSYDYHTPFEPDYMAQFDKQGRSVVGYDNDNSIWDQSNWVELDFSNLENGAELAALLQGKKIQAATVKGVYTKPNHKIVLTSAPIEGEAMPYAPNTFCPVNFMAENLGETGATSEFVQEGETAQNFFFLNPKVQEYGVVTNAVWVDNNTFVVPAQSTDYTINGHNFDGAFTVDWSLNNWDCFNEDQPQDQSTKLNEKEGQEGPQAYQFHAIIRKPETPVTTQARAQAIAGKNVTPDGTYLVYPLDLIVNTSHIVTAVQTVGGAKAVQSVTYCDLAGRMSSKPFAGINIVVTRYTDGTVKTSKLVF